MKMNRTNWTLAIFAMALVFWIPQRHSLANETFTVVDQGKARVYLDIGAKQIKDLGLANAMADFTRCISIMTGQALPVGGTSGVGAGGALFDPAQSQPTRFECQIVKLEDASASGSSNARFSLIASTHGQFVKNPFAEAGEKVAWSIAWNRGKGTLTFDLKVANQAYYGPGYGPITFEQLKAKAPNFTKGSTIRLVLEMQGGNQGNIRGGYAIDDQPWVYTQWYDPTKAGVDNREPGESDKKGPQAWTANWQKQWAGKTAFYISAYHPKGRLATVSLKDIRVTRADKTLFFGQASEDEMDKGEIGPWRVCQTQGGAALGYGVLMLKPAPGGWNNITLQATQSKNVTINASSSSSLIPLRLELKDYPAGTNPWGVSLEDIRLAQGFVIDASDKAVVIRAYTSSGFRNALYYMLDSWGCRWIMPGKIGECIPTRTTLTLGRGVTEFSPRNHFAFDRKSNPWGSRNMANWHNWLSAQHYWLYALPPKKYFKTNPHWYSLLAGERKPQQLCTSNPEVVEAMIKAAKAFFKKRPAAISFPMDPADNSDFCQCDVCVAVGAPGKPTKDGMPIVTDRVLAFANAVAVGIRDEFPDRYVAFYAYATHIEPPVKTKPVDNVIIGLCRTNHCILHLVPTEKCEASNFGELVKRWRALTPNLYLYEYDPISWTGGLPSPIYMGMMRSLKEMFNEHGVRGSYSDGRYALTGASTYLNRYLSQRMKIDPSQDPDQVLREMCESFFGPAAKPMEQYYRELATVTDSDTAHQGREKIGFGLTYYHEIFNPKIVRTARGFLDQAITIGSAQTPYRERLDMVDMSQRYLEAYLDGVWQSQDHQYKKAVDAFARMDKVIKELVAGGFLNAADAKQRSKTMRLKTLAKYFPKELGFFTEWKLLGPFDNSDRNAARYRDPFEPIASTSGPVVLKDGTTAHWRNYKSPFGFLDLKNALTNRKNPDKLAYVFASTTYNSQRNMRVQLRMDSYNPFVVYVNGKQVYDRQGNDADCPDKRQVEVRMNKGTNTLVFKLSQTNFNAASFPWGLYARVVADGPDTIVPPEKWSFKTDPSNIGTEQGWHASSFDDSQWQRIKVPLAWEKSIGAYDGYAWYRTKIQIPKKFAGKAMEINFAGVDEQAWVYLNGTYLGERTIASTKKTAGDIWNQPFKLAISPDRLQYGRKNLLVVRVHDSKYAGGIYFPVRLRAAQ